MCEGERERVYMCGGVCAKEGLVERGRKRRRQGDKVGGKERRSEGAKGQKRRREGGREKRRRRRRRRRRNFFRKEVYLKGLQIFEFDHGHSKVGSIF